MSYSKQKIIHHKTPFHPAKGKLSLKLLINHRLSISREYKVTFENYETALNEGRAAKKAGLDILFYTIEVYSWSEAMDEEYHFTIQTRRDILYRQNDKDRWEELQDDIKKWHDKYGKDLKTRFMRFVFVLDKEFANATKSKKAANAEKLRLAKQRKHDEIEAKKRTERNKRARIRRDNAKYGILEAEARRRHAEKLAREERDFERRHNAAKRARTLRKAKALAKKGFV